MSRWTSSRLTGSIALAGLFAVAASGCVVVPLSPDGRPPVIVSSGAPGVAPQVVAAAPASLTLPVRLYPTNDIAAGVGPIAGTVTNQLTGKGTFTLNVGGETMSGEATRNGAGSAMGVASAYGIKGGYANCNYTMNNSSQGTGRCTFSNGAQYQLHIGG